MSVKSPSVSRGCRQAGRRSGARRQRASRRAAVCVPRRPRRAESTARRARGVPARAGAPHTRHAAAPRRRRCDAQHTVVGAVHSPRRAGAVARPRAVCGPAGRLGGAAAPAPGGGAARGRRLAGEPERIKFAVSEKCACDVKNVCASHSAPKIIHVDHIHNIPCAASSVCTAARRIRRPANGGLSKKNL